LKLVEGSRGGRREREEYWPRLGEFCTAQNGGVLPNQTEVSPRKTRKERRVQSDYDVQIQIMNVFRGVMDFGARGASAFSAFSAVIVLACSALSAFSAANFSAFAAFSAAIKQNV
jgi:hypothetical protein